jgi:hypothetical protein
LPKALLVCGVLALSLSVPSSASAQSNASASARGGQPGGADSPQAFARLLVAAINSKSIDSRMALLHGRSRACVTAETRPYFESIFLRQTRYSIPADHQIRASALRSDQPLTSDGRSPLPVTPTSQVEIEFGQSSRSTTIVVLVARDGDRWGQVLGCPSPETVALMLQNDLVRVKQESRARELANGMGASLRADIQARVKAGRLLEAIRAYADASGEDLAMARRVVEIVAPR